jgi:PAS domain S-box-containing protein
MINTLFAGIREPLFLLQQDYRILDANEPMLSLLGLPKEEVVGRTCHEISHRSLQPCNSRACHCPMKETLKTGLSAHAIHEHLDRENQPRYLEVFTYPLKNNDDQVDMVFEFYRDITDDLESRLERKARQVKKDLKLRILNSSAAIWNLLLMSPPAVGRLYPICSLSLASKRWNVVLSISMTSSAQ